jgi:hypothetical protein
VTLLSLRNAVLLDTQIAIGSPVDHTAAHTGLVVGPNLSSGSRSRLPGEEAESWTSWLDLDMNRGVSVRAVGKPIVANQDSLPRLPHSEVLEKGGDALDSRPF